MTIHTFPVEAYDQNHLDLLKKGSRGTAIARIIKSGLRATDAEILIHSMFTEQDPNRTGFRSYRELAKKAASREATFRDYIDMTGASVYATGAQNTTQKTQTERLGVACAVLAMNKILGTTEADWERIEESNQSKTLDYRRVSEGRRIVAVEAKGTVAEEPAKRSSGSCGRMRLDIDRKKEALRAAKAYPAHEAFGVITSIGKGRPQTPRIYLMDPPTHRAETDPRRMRVLLRLNYYLKHLALVSRFRMLIALRNRINALTSHASIDAFDGLQLTEIDGKPFASRIVIGKRPLVEAGGVIGRVLFGRGERKEHKEERTLFIGFAKPLFSLLVSQDFGELLDWRWTPGADTTHRVRLPVKVLESEDAVEVPGQLTVGTNRAGIALGWFRHGG